MNLGIYLPRPSFTPRSAPSRSDPLQSIYIPSKRHINSSFTCRHPYLSCIGEQLESRIAECSKTPKYKLRVESAFIGRHGSPSQKSEQHIHPARPSSAQTHHYRRYRHGALSPPRSHFSGFTTLRLCLVTIGDCFDGSEMDSKRTLLLPLSRSCH